MVVSASMMRNERASDTEFVETLMFTDRMIYSLSDTRNLRPKKV